MRDQFDHFVAFVYRQAPVVVRGPSRSLRLCLPTCTSHCSSRSLQNHRYNDDGAQRHGRCQPIPGSAIRTAGEEIATTAAESGDGLR